MNLKEKMDQLYNEYRKDRKSELMKYQIFIPSYNRLRQTSKQIAYTIELLNKHDIEFNVIVRSEQLDQYRQLYPYKNANFLPIGKIGIGLTRNAIVQYAFDHNLEWIWMIDDDLKYILDLYIDVNHPRFGRPNRSVSVKDILESVEKNLNNFKSNELSLIKRNSSYSYVKFFHQGYAYFSLRPFLVKRNQPDPFIKDTKGLGPGMFFMLNTKLMKEHNINYDIKTGNNEINGEDTDLYIQFIMKNLPGLKCTNACFSDGPDNISTCWDPETFDEKTLRTVDYLNNKWGRVIKFNPKRQSRTSLLIT